MALLIWFFNFWIDCKNGAINRDSVISYLNCAQLHAAGQTYAIVDSCFRGDDDSLFTLRTIRVSQTLTNTISGRHC